MRTLFYKYLVFCIVLIALSITSFSQTNLEKGINLYRQGKFKKASKFLEKAIKKEKSDPEIWNYLGLAYVSQTKLKKARKSFEKAIYFAPYSSTFHVNLAYVYLVTRKLKNAEMLNTKAINLDPKNTDAYIFRGKSYLWSNKFEKAILDADKAISIKQNLSDAYILKADALLYSFGTKWVQNAKPSNNLIFLGRAIKVLETCIIKCEKNQKSERLSLKLQALNAFYSYYKNHKEINSTGSTSEPIYDDPIKIKTKPRPDYNYRAKLAGTQGKIMLAVLFSSKGIVGDVIVLEGLGNGLNRQAIEAARKIKFEPAKKNGKPVYVVKRLQYHFAIY